MISYLVTSSHTLVVRATVAIDVRIPHRTRKNTIPNSKQQYSKGCILAGVIMRSSNPGALGPSWAGILGALGGLHGRLGSVWGQGGVGRSDAVLGRSWRVLWEILVVGEPEAGVARFRGVLREVSFREHEDFEFRKKRFASQADQAAARPPGGAKRFRGATRPLPRPSPGCAQAVRDRPHARNAAPTLSLGRSKTLLGRSQAVLRRPRAAPSLSDRSWVLIKLSQAFLGRS